MNNEIINVTQPPVPSVDELTPYLEDIFQSKQLTNGGKYHNLLEKKLANFLEVPYVSLFNNGTLALVTAIQSLGLEGEAITTPYTFAATTNSIWWNNLKPVFVDIEPLFYNIDSSKIEEKITSNTSAIIPVHVYGNPCNVDEIQSIANKYNLKVIYDAAHAFGVTYNGKSLLNHGDFSVLSFHATKVFSTIEGGAVISKSLEMKERLDNLRNFGLKDETSSIGPGLNSKLNEIQAAFGLVQLNHVLSHIDKRKKVAEFYSNNLSDISGIETQIVPLNTSLTYTYFPISVDEHKFGLSRDKLYEKLGENNINCRRYFYPLVSDFEPFSQLESSQISNLPVSKSIVEKVLCLPIYPSIKKEDLSRIIEIIKS